ncbi:class I SAM-dependent methyltransferase [Candidatus Falkowbacteria bacterium]|nr:MAG: class I SAM-dependent methyltransferase [Candidatus Falkowbacteria bacterium]
MQSLINKIAILKDKNNHLNYGRPIIKKWVQSFSFNNSQNLKVLDVGCGKGYDLINIHKTLSERDIQSDLYGIEIFDEYKDISKEKGITVASLNLETDEFPYFDEYFDIIVINQVLEHVKEFFWIVSEINRVLKNGGLLIIGVPNLASWHNRLLLLFGQQPTPIRILGPHVRGYTKNDLVKTMTTYGGFKLYDYGGSNFYPFPPFISKIFSKVFPLGSVSLFCAFKKIKKSTFKEFLSERLETNFKMPKS